MYVYGFRVISLANRLLLRLVSWGSSSVFWASGSKITFHGQLGWCVCVEAEGMSKEPTSCSSDSNADGLALAPRVTVPLWRFCLPPYP